MQIEYTKYGDYLLPNLIIKEHKKDNIGKYGLIILNHLKTNNRTLYQSLLIQDKLTYYLININKKVNNLINELTEKENINEDLKEKAQLQWVGLMNNLRNIAEEIVLSEYLRK